ncbi:MAG: CHAD domain-containing protein [Planctomycetota bacterium]
MNDRDALLDRPPEAAIRILALPFLDGAAAAAGLLEADADAGALHDFRVALRRLRTLLKAYRGLFRDSVPRKQARALRDLARSTGAARDAEVQLEWLATQGEELKPGARRALSWMVERLEGRRQAAYSTVRGDVLRRFRELERRLRSGLSRYRATVAPDPARATFALAAAERVRSAGAELVAALEAVRAPSDVEEAHRARIEAKRFRYLLEPLQGTSLEPPVGRLVRSAKALQDVLGKLHDMHVLAGEIASSLVETAAERARTLHEALYSTDPESPGRDLRSGILAIDRLVRDRVEALLRGLRALWPAESPEPFAAEVEALAVALGRQGGRGPGIGRKFLLASLPAIEATPVDITQGWIPGRSLRERLEKVVSGGEERFYRAVRDGSGANRVELQEEASREAFECLWPLTEGRRVRKRRYRIAEGDRVWEVDEFLDRELVLAELAQHGSDGEWVLPVWLGPQVAREVTGEDPYLDENLAR